MSNESKVVAAINQQTEELIKRFSGVTEEMERLEAALNGAPLSCEERAELEALYREEKAKAEEASRQRTIETLKAFAAEHGIPSGQSGA